MATRTNHAHSLRLLALATVALAWSQLLCQAQAQQVWPLQGQGVPPPGGPSAVTVDVLVEVLRSINSDSNSWNAVHWLHLTWNDSRAAPAILDSTSRWVNGSSSCAMPCDASRSVGAGCCDNVWLPHIDATNVVAIPQEAVNRYRIWVEPIKANVTNANGTTTTVETGGSLVHWVTRVTAEWQSPFDFRAWPFEHQHLLVELQVTPSLASSAYLVMGQALFVTNSPHTKGDEVPGWYVAKITRRLYNTTACWLGSAMGTTTSVYSVSSDAQTVDLKTLNAASWAQLRSQNNATITTVTSLATTACNPQFNVEATAQYAPNILVVDIMVRRTQVYYVLSTVLPLLLLDYMVFITYAMERGDLEARMGVVVTLVLSISALQFTYNFPPSSYLNAVQQITLASYCLFFAVAIESMVTSQICRLHARKRSWTSLVNTAHGTLQHAQSGPLGMSRSSSSAIGLAAGGPSDPDGFKGAPTGKALTLATGWGGARTLKRQTSSMRPERETPGSTSAPRDTIAEEASGDLSLPGRYQASPRPSADADATSFGGARTSRLTPSSDSVHAHVELEVVELGGKGARKATTRTPTPGPLAEATELSSADEGAQQVPAGTSGLRQRSGPTARKRKGGCMSRMSCGDSTQEEAEPCEGTGSGVPVRRRSSLDGIPQALTRAGSTVATKSREIRGRIDADEAYAQMFAARMDQIFSWSLVVCFTVVVSVLLYVNQQVGDHKLMLSGDAPANM